jgi:RNA polymerase sigma factor (sigma-70 family)
VSGHAETTRGMSEAELKTDVPLSGDVPQIVEHLFRQEASRLIATLTGIFGIQNLNLAEDVVQEALVRALQTWPYYGIPDNPSAWLMRTAKNLALDVLRREKVFREKEPQIAASMEQQPGEPDVGDEIQFENEIKEDRLRLMFACCDPLIPQEAQVALALKTLCGFGTVEIAKAFLTTEASIAKRLTRAKQRIRETGVPFEIPAGEELVRRLDSVSQTLYLLFNEGYKASTGERILKEELCEEAIRLTSFLVSHPVGNQPKTHALLALMSFNAGRLPARVDSQGNILRLEEQDRSAWDRPLIARGMFHLAQSAGGDELSKYHLEAAIAACHCAAPDYNSTDWAQILALYDQLVRLDQSAIVALNRAVAVANVHGAEASIAAVDLVRNRPELNSYYLLYAVLGDLEARRANFALAADYFRQSLKLTDVKSEQIFLASRIRACEGEVLACGAEA